uniref:Uncharacterized protein n=1 Tax=Cacopsylla melanoneura TaxID=428564 RepID=A0A8D8UT61_9HEMI
MKIIIFDFFVFGVRPLLLQYSSRASSPLFISTNVELKIVISSAKNSESKSLVPSMFKPRKPLSLRKSSKSEIKSAKSIGELDSPCNKPIVTSISSVYLSPSLTFIFVFWYKLWKILINLTLMPHLYNTSNNLS